MPIEIIMPKVDMDMTSGKVLNWHVSSGTTVKKGDLLFDIETDKAAMEIESHEDGIIYFPVSAGESIPVGKPVAWLFEEDEEVIKPNEPKQVNMKSLETDSKDAKEKLNVEETNDFTSKEHTTENNANGKIRATPLARSLAKKANLDIAAITGSGIRRRVQADDVRILVDFDGDSSNSGQSDTNSQTLHISNSSQNTENPIVLIHGFASDSSSWKPLERHLNYQNLIRIDLPSHGKSPLRKISKFTELVREIRLTFDRNNIKRAHLVGHSLGAAVALALTDVRNQLISTLTLIAPAGLGPEINGNTISGICNAKREESLGPWLKCLVANEEIISNSYVRAAMTSRRNLKLRESQIDMLNVIFPDGVQAFDLRAALKRVEIPTCIIWGKRDAVIPWQHSLKAPGRIALHLFDDVGHLPQFEIAAEVGRILTSHMSKNS